jgi:hypothetical protein
VVRRRTATEAGDRQATCGTFPGLGIDALLMPSNGYIIQFGLSNAFVLFAIIGEVWR